jgi:hypothetical protein
MIRSTIEFWRSSRAAGNTKSHPEGASDYWSIPGLTLTDLSPILPQRPREGGFGRGPAWDRSRFRRRHRLRDRLYPGPGVGILQGGCFGFPKPIWLSSMYFRAVCCFHLITDPSEAVFRLFLPSPKRERKTPRSPPHPDQGGSTTFGAVLVPA